MDKFPELERLLQGKKIVILLELTSWQARPGVRQRQRKTVRQSEWPAYHVRLKFS